VLSLTSFPLDLCLLGRIAKCMLECAAERGDLTGPSGEKKVILAASSGNTGCSLALVGTLMGYQVVVITNAKCSEEKRSHIRSNGATLWMAEELPAQFPDIIGAEKDYMKQEDLLAAALPDRYYSVNQYGNADNMDAHRTTGAEIYSQTGGDVTHFVMASSTGGAIMGVGSFLKEQKESVQIVLADPDKSHLAGYMPRTRTLCLCACADTHTHAHARTHARTRTRWRVRTRPPHPLLCTSSFPCA
jgi:cysteine synthase